MYTSDGEYKIRKKEVSRRKRPVSPSKVKGPQAKGYQEDEAKRARARLRRRSGITYKICELKDVTGDDVKISFYRNDVSSPSMPQQDLVLSTEQRLLQSELSDCSNSQSGNSPDLSVGLITSSDLLLLPPASPTKPKGEVKLSQPIQGKGSCAICSIKYKSEMDKAFAQLNGIGCWLGCSVKSCKWYAHARCLGFTVLPEKQFDGFEFYCKKHCKPKLPGAQISTKKANKKK